MDHDTLKQVLRDYSSRDLEQRTQWYSPAAAYDRVRPKYPETLLRQVAAIAQLSPSSRILEVGCGPGTATMALAVWGCEVVICFVWSPILSFTA